MDTLPDYLAPGLDIVFVGLNPGLQSVRDGHYFASPSNRFWRAINRSGLLTEPLEPRTDSEAIKQGIGFTDVVKRPSSGAADLRAADFRHWSPVLREKLERCQPLIACFHGVTAYRNFLKYTDGNNKKVELGLQPLMIGNSRVFVIPNPSPRNAAYSMDDLVEWYQRLKAFLDEVKSS